MTNHKLRQFLIQFMSTQSYLDDRLLKKILAKEARGAVLDVGCGNGRLSELMPGAKSYQGVDMFLGPSGNDVADIHKLPYKDEQFDVSIANAVLEHVKDPEAVLSEMVRVTKKGGKIIVTVPFLQPLHEDPTDFRRYTISGLKLLFKENGLGDAEVFVNYGAFVTLEYVLVSSLIQTRKRRMWAQNLILWPLMLIYYLIQGLLLIVLRIINTLTFLLQRNEDSTYAGFGLVGVKK